MDSRTHRWSTRSISRSFSLDWPHTSHIRGVLRPVHRNPHSAGRVGPVNKICSTSSRRFDGVESDIHPRHGDQGRHASGSLAMIFLKPVLDARLLSYVALVLAIYWVVRPFLQEALQAHPQAGDCRKTNRFRSDRVSSDLRQRWSRHGTRPCGVESRVEDQTPLKRGWSPPSPDVALKLLDDPNPATRAEAAVSLAAHRMSGP